MRKTFFVLLFSISYSSFASHIVGGEIQFYTIDRPSSRFFVGLNLYFDAVNGRPAAETPTVTLYFFRKSDNTLLGNIQIPQVIKKNINYTNPNCTVNADLSTYFISYGSEITLSASTFNDPAGYYIVWERCCRNSIVSNIINPASTGATFYLAFPALTQNGQAFLNSSPRTSELKGDYICANRPFTFDFSAKDPDGDSLVYSLVTPYRGYSNTVNPEPIATGSFGYPEVTWASGIFLTNIIPGPKPLAINSKTGQISVTAGQLGLYVFAVMIEEYRKGLRIGIVRREFQLKVVECPKNEPPIALYREAGKKDFYKKGQIITIKQNQSKCLDILITDPEANQRLSITTKVLNFDDKSLTITPSIFTTKNTKDTLKAQICLAPCVESRNNQPIIFEIVVQDDGCPQPLYDTLTIRAIIEPSALNKPTIYTDLLTNTASVEYGNTLKFNVIAGTSNGSDFTLEARGRGFDLTTVGMSFVNLTATTGTIKKPFTWTPNCAATNRDYVVDFIITTTGCGGQIKDTVSVTMRANTKPNQKPKVSTSLPNNYIEIKAGERVAFDVFGNDADKDAITLSGFGKSFDLRTYGMRFDEKRGQPQLVSTFEWQPDCDLATKIENQVNTIYFKVEDNSCAANRADTISIQIKVLPPTTNLIDSTITNVITANSDGKNDCFSIDYKSNSKCGPQFESIEIVNRWGKVLFSSQDPAFKWCAEDAPSSSYYYVMKFTNKTIKGIINVIK